jgi:hypothetical protein
LIFGGRKMHNASTTSTTATIFSLVDVINAPGGKAGSIG